MWPWGACWLQEWPQEAIDVWRGVAECLEGLEGFKGLEGLERFRAGKRQTWVPIRSH